MLPYPASVSSLSIKNCFRSKSPLRLCRAPIRISFFQLLHLAITLQIPEDVKDMFIDIFDEQYALIRSILLETGREAHRWIRDYLLKSDQVVVSSPDHFLELLDGWERDPCLDKEE